MTHRKTNFFIVGTPKAGTTSLFFYLEKHPDVFMPPIKETNYFSSEEIKAQRLYYKAEVLDSLDKYEKQFLAINNQKAIGEGSVSYLFYPLVPLKIYEYNPDAKIIIILRDPVDRAFSHYLMDSRLGFVADLSFEDIVFKLRRHENLDLFYQQFLELGLYYEQVKRYLDAFGKKQVKVFLYEDFQKNAKEVVSSVCAFLEIDQNRISFEVVKHNSFLEGRYKFVRALYKKKWVRQMFANLLPKRLVSITKSQLFDNSSKPKMKNETASYLRTFYKKDVQNLEKLIGENLENWYSEA